MKTDFYELIWNINLIDYNIFATYCSFLFAKF